MTIFQDQPALLSAYRRGDSQAFGQVYLEYVDQVAALARRGFCQTRGKQVVVPGISDPDLHGDLVQETFTRAFSTTARNNYQASQPFRPYLLRILKNLMIDGLRKKGRELSPSQLPDQSDDNQGVGDIDKLLDQNAPFEDESPGDKQHFNNQQQACKEFIESCAPLEKEAYRLIYQEELSQQKTAEQMGITRRKVRTLESRLRKGLQQYLKSCGLWP
jgi:RNA polymerase sigma factor (sigma-70 family)